MEYGLDDEHAENSLPSLPLVKAAAAEAEKKLASSGNGISTTSSLSSIKQQSSHSL